LSDIRDHGSGGGGLTRRVARDYVEILRFAQDDIWLYGRELSVLCRALRPILGNGLGGFDENWRLTERGSALGQTSEGGLTPPPQSNLEISLKAGHYKNQEMMVIWST